MEESTLKQDLVIRMFKAELEEVVMFPKESHKKTIHESNLDYYINDKKNKHRFVHAYI